MRSFGKTASILSIVTSLFLGALEVLFAYFLWLVMIVVALGGGQNPLWWLFVVFAVAVFTTLTIFALSITNLVLIGNKKNKQSKNIEIALTILGVVSFGLLILTGVTCISSNFLFAIGAFAFAGISSIGTSCFVNDLVDSKKWLVELEKETTIVEETKENVE